MQSIIEKHFKFNYPQLIKRATYRVGGSIPDAEDVVMEAYARALKYKDSFEMGMPFNHWFNRILANVLKDWKQDQFHHSLPEEFDEEKIEPIENGDVKQNLIERITFEIEQIPNEDSREVLRLNLICGFKIREIVQITDKKPRAVKMLIHRFQKQLKERHA